MQLRTNFGKILTERLGVSVNEQTKHIQNHRAWKLWRKPDKRINQNLMSTVFDLEHTLEDLRSLLGRFFQNQSER